MGVMTLKQFRDQTCSGIQRGTPAQVGVELVDTWIHNTMYEFGYAFKFRELEGYEEQVLAAGGNALVFPEAWRMMHDNGIEILGVENYEGALIPETRAQYIKRNRTVGSQVITGRPVYYHIFGPLFKVRPTVDQDYTVAIHYWRRLDRLVEETEVSIFPDDWDDVILTGAQFRGFRHFNEYDRYQNIRNDYLGMIRSRKFEADIEEFPEGGISAVDYHSREDDAIYGHRDSADEDFGDNR